MSAAKIVAVASIHNPMSSAIPATEKEDGISTNGSATPSSKATLTKFLSDEKPDLRDEPVKTKQFLTEPKYIRFISLGMSRSGKTEVWRMDSGKDGVQLGEIRWFGRWRQYCFFPTSETVFSKGCLGDIRDFIKGRMEYRKQNSKSEFAPPGSSPA